MEKNRNIESWHSLYPNRKRERKNENNRRFLFYCFLDKLIELGYQEKITVHSSVGIDFCFGGDSNYLRLIFIIESKLFKFEIKINDKIETFTENEIDEAVKRTIDFIELEV